MAKETVETNPVPDDIADLMEDSDETEVKEEAPDKTKTPESEAAPEGDKEKPAEEKAPCPDGEPCEEPLSERQLIELLQTDPEFSQLGVDVSKYTNDRQALKGLLNAVKLVGARDVDAQVGKALRGRLGDDEVTRIIRGEKLPEPKEPDKKASDAQVDFDESWLFQVQLDPQSGDLIPAAGAPKDLPDKIKKYYAHREKVLNEFVKNPEAVLDRLLQGRFQHIEELVTSKTRQLSASQQQETSVKQWVAENATVLWVNGDPEAGTTQLGDEFFSKAASLAEAGISDPIKQLTLALEMVQGAVARRVPPVKPANPRAQHAGSGSRNAQKFNSPEDMMDYFIEKEDMDLADAYRKAQKEWKP